MKSPIPEAALDDRLGFVGTSGSGKTYAAKGRVERLLSLHRRVVVVDPLDVWYGLRLKTDGHSPAFPIAILGGRKGDLALNEHSGALIGETVARSTESAIVSLGGLKTQASRQRFMLAFLDALYEHTDAERGDPYHLVLDEADLWAPQKPMGNEMMLAHLTEEIVRRGRVKGFIPWLITQRPAVINKNVLSQVDGLIAMKLTSSQDRDALGAWIEGQADRAQSKAMLAALPGLDRGSGVVWIPGRGILDTAPFPENETFDSSRTPRRGEKRHEAALKPLNLTALKDRLASVEAEAKANDPKELKAEVARLKKQLETAPSTAAPGFTMADINAAKKEGFDECRARVLARNSVIHQGAMRIKVDMGLLIEDIEADIDPAPGNPKMPVQRTEPRPANIVQRVVPSRKSSDGTDMNLGKGEQAVLIVAAQSPGGATREQISVISGYKRRTRDTYIQRLCAAGLMEISADCVSATEAGFKAIGNNFKPLPTGSALRSHWLATLPSGEARILDLICDCYPDSIAREDLDGPSGFLRRTRDTYIQRLSARRLISEAGRGRVRASHILY